MVLLQPNWQTLLGGGGYHTAQYLNCNCSTSFGHGGTHCTFNSNPLGCRGIQVLGKCNVYLML